jgi:hypothetical protein
MMQHDYELQASIGSSNPGWRSEEQDHAAPGIKLGRDVTAQLGPVVGLERATNLVSGLNEDR